MDQYARAWTALATALLVLSATDARAGLCGLAVLCPDLDAEELCEASEGECFSDAFECVQRCPVENPRPQVPACIAACEDAYVACATEIYPPGRSCYPCAFDPDRCDDRCVPPDLPGGRFEEGWTGTPRGSYVPFDATSLDEAVIIDGEGGNWLLGDTVSNFPECGPTPNRADVLRFDGSRALRLTSGDSGSSCGDNIWATLDPDFPPIGNEFQIPFDQATRISFKQFGRLDSPSTGLPGCLVRPCGDTVSLTLRDNQANSLAYVFQRAPTAEPNTIDPSYREIFLDDTAGSPPRNLFDDFARIPEFDASHDCGFWITSITFAVDEHGEGVIDDLCVAESGCGPIVVPEPGAAALRLAAVSALALLVSRRPGSPRCVATA